jgi:hypothetical protein
MSCALTAVPSGKAAKIREVETRIRKARLVLVIGHLWKTQVSTTTTQKTVNFAVFFLIRPHQIVGFTVCKKRT